MLNDTLFESTGLEIIVGFNSFAGEVGEDEASAAPDPSVPRSFRAEKQLLPSEGISRSSE
jgi:hypothetical protein